MPAQPESLVKWEKWVAGIGGTWFVLNAMAETDSFKDLAVALAFSVAVAATFIHYRAMTNNIDNFLRGTI